MALGVFYRNQSAASIFRGSFARTPLDCLHWEVFVDWDGDKSNMDFKPYLDIKPEALRNVLRGVLKDMPWLSLPEDMPTVTTASPCSG